MPELNLTIGSLVVTPLFWALGLATFFSSFSFWRRLKDDFREEEIFTLTLLVLVAALFSSRLFYLLFHFQDSGFSPLLWFFSGGERFSLGGAFLGAVLAINWQTSRLEKNAWEVLDALVLPLFYFLIFGGLGHFFNYANKQALAYSLIGLLGSLSYPWLKKSYRSFAWYKSGKTGFLISFYSFWIFLSLFSLAFFENHKLYWEKYFWLVLTLLSLIALYYRSERSFRDDSRRFWQNLPWLKLGQTGENKWQK